MRIAVASGKGGTGKTTVATNLACVASRNGRSVVYVDCDVEEPNGHIFLKPQLESTAPAGVRVPKVDEDKCTHCGKCAEICRFNAIVALEQTVLVFAELCHGCGGCVMVCPAGAVTEVLHETGVVEVGRAGPIGFVHGRLNVGQVMSPPVIKAVRAAASEADLVILDAPPGTGCPVIASVRGCDYVVLVTEPTPFGLNDLKLAVDLARSLDLPFGVVINREGLGDERTDEYCQREGIAVLARIPDDRRIAEAYSRGDMICDVLPEYGATFVDLHRRIADPAEART